MWVHVLQRLMNELKLESENPMLLYYDNKSTPSIAQLIIIEQSTLKLIDILSKRSWKEDYSTCHIYITSNAQLADFLTRWLPRVNLEGLITKLGMIDVHAPTCGGVLKNPNLWWREDQPFQELATSLVL